MPVMYSYRSLKGDAGNNIQSGNVVLRCKLVTSIGLHGLTVTKPKVEHKSLALFKTMTYSEIASYHG